MYVIWTLFSKHSTYVDAYIYARTLTFKIHAHNRTPMSIFKRPSRQISEINEVIIGISLSIARHLPLKVKFWNKSIKMQAPMPSR